MAKKYKIKKTLKKMLLDEIINGARLDYALGNYTTHTCAESLIIELKKNELNCIHNS